MRLEQQQIRAMYREIQEYSGDFGDSIEGLVAPFERLEDSTLSKFERDGVCVAVLCWLMNAIDNSTHERAVTESARRVAAVLHSERGRVPSSILTAFCAFGESEEAFAHALRDVYRDVVVPSARQ